MKAPVWVDHRGVVDLVLVGVATPVVIGGKGKCVSLLQEPVLK